MEILKEKNPEQYGPDEYMNVVHVCGKGHKFAVPMIETTSYDNIYIAGKGPKCPVCGSKDCEIVYESEEA
jgi:hydrogenase maturation factor